MNTNTAELSMDELEQVNGGRKIGDSKSFLVRIAQWFLNFGKGKDKSRMKADGTRPMPM